MHEAIDVVSKTCAYTNHTILAEALEKWPIDYLEEVVPHLMPIIHELDAQAKKKYKDENVAIIDKDQRVHMAHMDIHYGFSVNGVAALHTEILKNSELNNVLRYLSGEIQQQDKRNHFPPLAAALQPVNWRSISTSLIGRRDSKKMPTELEKLLKYKDDKKVLDKACWRSNRSKQGSANSILYETQNIELDENSIYRCPDQTSS